MGKGKLKVEDNISIYYDSLINAVGGVSTSLQTMIKLQKEVDGMKWNGNSRDHFVALLDIILQYHKDMEMIGEEFKTNINHFGEHVDRYNTYPTMKKLSGIE